VALIKAAEILSLSDDAVIIRAQYVGLGFDGRPDFERSVTFDISLSGAAVGQFAEYTKDWATLRDTQSVKDRMSYPGDHFKR
jgi:hypothetical protein